MKSVHYCSYFSMKLRLKSVLERLVLKKYAECTSQHVKWTSGARVMIFCCLSMLDRSVDRSLGRSLARSVAPSVGRSLDRSLGRSVARSLARSLDRSLDRSIDRSIARSIARSLARSIAHCDHKTYLVITRHVS